MREDNIEITFNLLYSQVSKWKKFISKKWLIILIVSLLGASVGYLINYKSKPVYLANLTFTLEDKNSSLNSSISILNTLGMNIGVSEIFTGDNLPALFQTRLIVEETLLSKINVNGHNTSLAQLYIKINKIDSTWPNNDKLKNIDFNSNEKRSLFTRQKDSILFELYRSISRNSISISQTNSKINIYTLKIKTNNEQFSKILCESLYSTTSKFYINQITQKANSNFELLKKERDSIKALLNTTIINSGEYEDKSYNLNSAYTQLKTNSEVGQINIKINNSLYNTINSNLEAARLNLSIKTPLMMIIDEPKYPLEKKEGDILSLVGIYFLLTSLMTIIFLTIKQLFNNMLNH
jgi:hypothetical protein